MCVEEYICEYVYTYICVYECACVCVWEYVYVGVCAVRTCDFGFILSYVTL